MIEVVYGMLGKASESVCLSQKAKERENKEEALKDLLEAKTLLDGVLVAIEAERKRIVND